mgnify:CR=1 FL=1
MAYQLSDATRTRWVFVLSLNGGTLWGGSGVRYLVGQFNAHLASCLFLQADEGFWAGDKQAEGRLKGLITSEYQMIELKGVDHFSPYTGPVFEDVSRRQVAFFQKTLAK